MFKQSRSSQVPLLAELAPRQYLAINPKTARERNINDGDEIWVGSQNAVTGERRRLKVQARYFEGIWPDVDGVSLLPKHKGTEKLRVDLKRRWAQSRNTKTPSRIFCPGAAQF